MRQRWTTATLFGALVLSAVLIADAHAQRGGGSGGAPLPLAEALRQAAVFLPAQLRQARPLRANPASCQLTEGPASSPLTAGPASCHQTGAVTGTLGTTLLHSWPAQSSEQLPLLVVVMVLQGRTTTNL